MICVRKSFCGIIWSHDHIGSMCWTFLILRENNQKLLVQGDQFWGWNLFSHPTIWSPCWVRLTNYMRGHFCKDFVWGGCGTNIQLLIDWQEQLFKTVANFLNPCWLHAKGSCEEATTIIRGVWSVSSVMLLLAAFVGLLLDSSSSSFFSSSSSSSSEVFPPQCSFSSCWQASLLVSWIIATAATFSHLATLLSCRRCWLIIGDKKGFQAVTEPEARLLVVEANWRWSEGVCIITQNIHLLTPKMQDDIGLDHWSEDDDLCCRTPEKLNCRTLLELIWFTLVWNVSVFD